MAPSQIVEAYHLRASIFFNLHEYGRDLPDFDEVIELSPQNAFALCQRGLTLGFLKRFADATRDFNASAKLEPTNKCLRAIQGIGEKAGEGAHQRTHVRSEVSHPNR